MVQKVAPDGVRLDVFNASNHSTNPDFSVYPDSGLIKSISVPKSLGPIKDQGELTLHNPDGIFRNGAKEITSGDRIEFWRQLNSELSMKRRFTGVVRQPDVEITQPGQSTLSFTLEEFVGSVMAFRNVDAGFTDRQIAGTPTSCIEMILDEECPEIGVDQIQPIETEVSIKFQATDVLEAMRRLIVRGEAVMWSDGTDLIVKPLTAAKASFELTPQDIYAPLSYSEGDDQYANAIRIDGGEVVAIQDRQTMHPNWFRVTSDNRIMQRIETPKSTVAAVDIWTDPRRTGSKDDLSVRLQNDNNGEPENPSDSSLDIAQKTLSYHFLAEHGWTYFDMPDNDTLDRYLWVILESGDAGDGTGQDVGISHDRDLAYRAYYSYPITVPGEDQQGIDEYRRREYRVSDDDIRSIEMAERVLNAQLRQRSILEREFTFEARSRRAHELRPLDVVHIDSREAGVVGDYVVTEVKDSYEGIQVNTDVTVTELDAVWSSFGSI